MKDGGRWGRYTGGQIKKRHVSNKRSQVHASSTNSMLFVCTRESCLLNTRKIAHIYWQARQGQALFFFHLPQPAYEVCPLHATFAVPVCCFQHSIPQSPLHNNKKQEGVHGESVCRQ